MVDVRVSETNVYGFYIYKIFVNHQFYDKFITHEPLSWDEKRSVESYYKDALDNYHPPVLELDND